MQLLQLVHLLADFIPDWDLIVMAFDQLSSVAATAQDHAGSSLPGQPRQASSNKMDWMQSASGVEGACVLSLPSLSYSIPSHDTVRRHHDPHTSEESHTPPVPSLSQ